ncbi:hypothetical protein CU285_18970 [Salmonella enterica]|nr:hypothetical protein [Salmonella enterica subsp. enterica serovar Poona]EAU0433161.1 hypothetical protein [Salmonella enterica]EAU6853194.1 hypothetical protein [Salmonella enterica]EAZ4478993.1 hypothetical protein [Salmonella enterica]EBC0414076.1 hypothetical protein [Salmonella enterica]
MPQNIKDLWLFPFPVPDVVHTQEPLLQAPELTTPGRCTCCRQTVKHRFRLDESWPLRQLSDNILDVTARLHKTTENLERLLKRGEPVTKDEKEKYLTALIAAEWSLEQAQLSARRLALRHVPKGLVALLDASAPPVYFLLFLLFCASFSLSIYLPFIPFIFWMTGIGNWIISVLIGCTAGPLWGATHLGTSQDRGSRAAYGYIYLIDSMIRPPLMVFGFFFASVAVVASGTILNALFGAALVNVQVNSFTGVFSLAGFLLIYARICTTIVAAIFALQAYLPDHVINFLGGRDGANTLGNLTSSVKDIFAGSNRNIRHTPGVKEDRLKNVTQGDNSKDGIKG